MTRLIRKIEQLFCFCPTQGMCEAQGRLPRVSRMPALPQDNSGCERNGRMSYIDRRIMIADDFGKFIKARWPSHIAEDCTQIDSNGADCLDRVDPETCLSCLAYDTLADEFDHIMRGT